MCFRHLAFSIEKALVVTIRYIKTTTPISSKISSASKKYLKSSIFSVLD